VEPFASMKEKNACSVPVKKNLMERDHLQDLDINNNMLLELVWTVFKWLGIGTSGWTL
jgi:hypothetical protein